MAITVTSLGANYTTTDYVIGISGITGLAAGDTIILISASDDDAPVSLAAYLKDASSNNIRTKTVADAAVVNSGNVVVRLFYFENLTASEAANISLASTRATQSVGANAVAVYKISGLVTSSPLDKTSTGTGTNAPYTTGATATLSQADEVCIAVIGIEEQTDNLGSWTTGASYVSGNEQSAGGTSGGTRAISIATAAKIVSSTAAQTGEMNASAPDWAALIATFKGYTGPIYGQANITLADITLNATGTVPYDHKIIDVDHESGDSSEYNQFVTDGGDLSISATAALAGTNYGLSCLIDDTSNIQGVILPSFNSPSGKVRARFYFDPNSLYLPLNSGVTLFHLIDSEIFTSVRYINDANVNKIQLISQAPGTPSITVSITDAPHYIEIYEVRASNSLDPGFMALWIDGSLISTESPYNYYIFTRITSAYFGAMNITDALISGTFYLDELVVRDDDQTIGPLSPQNITGAANITLEDITTTSTTVVKIDGTANITLEDISLSSTAKALIDASSALTLDDISLNASGIVQDPITNIEGQADITLEDISLVSAGTTKVDANADITLEDISLVSAGKTKVDANADITLEDITVVSDGKVEIKAGSSINLDDISNLFEGEVLIVGNSNILLDSLTLSSTGTVQTVEGLTLIASQVGSVIRLEWG